MRTRLLAVGTLMAASLLTSCGTLLSSRSTKDQPSQPKDPQHSVVFYGAAYEQGLIKKRPLVDLQFAQIDPQHQPQAFYTRRSGSFFWSDPVPVGGSWKLLRFADGKGQRAITYSFGIQGKRNIDPLLEKPGLLYLGSFVLGSDPETTHHRLDLRPVETPSELEALKAMETSFLKTDWAPVIAARIQELSK